MIRPALTGLFYLGLTVTLTTWPAPAQAQDTQSIDEREAAIFGESEEGSETMRDSDDAQDQESTNDSRNADKPDEIDAREAAIFGEPETDEPETDEPEADSPEPTDAKTSTAQTPTSTSVGDRLSARLAAQEEASLDIGGGLFSQLNYTILERGEPGEFPLTQPNLLDVYLDGRPNQRLRVYADARLTYTPTTAAQNEPVGATSTESTSAGLFSSSDDPVDVELNQLWIKFDIAHTIYVTAGRQHLRWGVGRFWYPNDFLFEQRRDPLALIDVRTGVDILKFHLPLESLGWNFYAVANLEGATSPETVGGAGRGEFLLGTTELGVSAAAQKDKPVQLGADISTAIGWFDLRASATLLHNLATPFFRGESNFSQFDTIGLENIGELQLPERFSREDEWIPRALVGAEVGIPYLEEDTFYLGAEYFFNAAGYDNADIYPWLILNGAFRPLYSGRHYAALYALAPNPGGWNDSTFTFSTLGNLSDLSFLSRLDYSVTVLTHLRVFAYTSVTYGKNGEFTLGLRVPAISADVLDAAQTTGQFSVPPGLALEDGFAGFSRAATRATIGGGLSLNF